MMNGWSRRKSRREVSRGGSYLKAAPMPVGAAFTSLLELSRPYIIDWLLLATSPSWCRAASGRWLAVLTQCGER